MRNIVSVDKIRTSKVGKVAGVAVIATLAMAFATPLMANPAMCGLPNVKATFKGAITQFTMNSDGTRGTFTPANPATPLMVGSYIEVSTPKGLMPATIRSISGSTTKPMIKGFLDPHVAGEAATITITGVTKTACTGMCGLGKAVTATMVKPITGFTRNVDGTFAFIDAPTDTVMRPGSWLAVTLSNGKVVPATISSAINATAHTAQALVDPLSSIDAQKVTVSMTPAQAAGTW